MLWASASGFVDASQLGFEFVDDCGFLGGKVIGLARVIGQMSDSGS